MDRADRHSWRWSLLLLLVLALPLASKESLPLSEQLAQLEQLDESEWGIRNGCVLLSRVRQMTFIDDQHALLKLSGNRRARLTLASDCPGIAANGYLLINRSGRLCSRFDSVAVLDNSFGGARAGQRCAIESIAPEVELEQDGG